MPQSKILNWLLWGGVPIAIMLFIALRQSSESTPQTLVPFNLSETENKIHYVTVNSLNFRSDSKVTADVVIKLRRNQEVKVFVDSGEWSKIATPHECWVVTKYLSDKPNPQGLSKGSSPLRLIDGANVSNKSSNDASHERLFASSNAVLGKDKRSYKVKTGSSRKKSNSAVKSYSKSRHKKLRVDSAYTGGTCPCSGHTVCIGPRGGRYCITSGGNKRYGV